MYVPNAGKYSRGGMFLKELSPAIRLGNKIEHRDN